MDGIQLSLLALDNVEAIVSGEYEANIWYRYDYVLDNGTPAVNCWEGGNK